MVGFLRDAAALIAISGFIAMVGVWSEALKTLV